MSKISEIIKQLRAEPFSLSQTEIEKETGISQSRLSRWEHNGASAGDDALKLVAFAESLRAKQPRKAKAVA